jgi:Arc/MetJ-type ribon-helix-helix transcriptional regulator
MIREALRRELNDSKTERSPRMRALLEELGESENPLEAPRSEEFFQKVHMRALAKF